MRRAVGLATLTLFLGACESNPTGGSVMNAPRNETAFLRTPDASFQLSPEQRASVHSAFNVDAIEKLLSWTKPEYRGDVLESFQASTIAALGEKVVLGEGTWDVDHPEIKQIVKKIHLPTRLPDSTGHRPVQ